MTAEETKRRGIKYCKANGEGCWKCPLAENHLCITADGELWVEFMSPDFIEFSKSFNFLIKELYKE